LFENKEKRFNLEKPLKIFNRRSAVKNQLVCTNSPDEMSKEPDRHLPPTKTIYNYFCELQSMILITSDGEILVYDKNLYYVGSYFTLQYKSLTECLSNHDLKYLFFLHENNDMEIINIYTQEKLISVENFRERVANIFFCHSEVYFCGYITSKKYNVVVYAYPDERYAAKNSRETKAVMEVSLIGLIQELSEGTHR
jgi:hypothetical protein